MHPPNDDDHEEEEHYALVPLHVDFKISLTVKLEFVYLSL